MSKTIEAIIFTLCRALNCTRYMDASHLKDNEVIECCVGDDVKHIICIFK